MVVRGVAAVPEPSAAERAKPDINRCGACTEKPYPTYVVHEIPGRRAGRGLLRPDPLPPPGRAARDLPHLRADRSSRMSHTTTDPGDPRLTHGPDPADAPYQDQAEVYLVLSEEERAKGFVRPVRTSYWHTVCGRITTMGLAIAETYARDPSFYGGTYCAHCGQHRPVGEHGEFHWVDPANPERQSLTLDPKVGT